MEGKKRREMARRGENTEILSNDRKFGREQVSSCNLFFSQSLKVHILQEGWLCANADGIKNIWNKDDSWQQLVGLYCIYNLCYYEPAYLCS